MKRNLRKRVQAWIDHHALLETGDTVLVAVSGGADSMALLHLLYQMRAIYDISLVVAHYNHRLRSSESDADEAFVRKQARLIDVAVVVDIDDGMLGNGCGNLEERARERRYGFLRKAGQEVGAHKIALGHTADDQVETLFLSLGRGAGMKGLGGMLAKRGMYIRPLLNLERTEVVEFLRAEEIPWVEDSSNCEDIFRRNVIRRTLIPLMEQEVTPHLVRVVNRTMEILRDEESWMESSCAAIYEELKEDSSAEGVVFPVSEFCSLPVALQRRIIRLALNEVSGTLRAISFNHVEAIRLLASSGAAHGAVSLPRGCTARRQYDRVWIDTGRVQPVAFHYTVESVPATLLIPEIDCSLRFDVAEGRCIARSQRSLAASLDAAAVQFPMVVRSVQNGDRFRPFGMAGDKKVSDFFIDSKVPFEERKRVPLVLSGERIAWIAGYRIDDHFKVTEKTEKTMIIAME
ncbi:MAG TPA: tRNA lysidine(34) synthetase TilS [Thermodesulfobacteriota bacterium]|nr:tRNA lysidine(34) synthetase TilS [Deltaproteobacteria bacterium]HNU71522.1 tRNA lysidine(34) synthetase TilS [Thermodesulfobacteriota bacterium]HOC38559.1 tRNA lysidine(34) synthetase TilS [Thermodesulfobacteriota bacterium]